MFTLHFHFARNQTENRHCKKEDYGLQTRVKYRLGYMKKCRLQNTEFKSIDCVIIVSGTDLTTNFIDMRALHQNSPENVAFLFC